MQVITDHTAAQCVAAAEIIADTMLAADGGVSFADMPTT